MKNTFWGLIFTAVAISGCNLETKALPFKPISNNLKFGHLFNSTFPKKTAKVKTITTTPTYRKACTNKSAATIWAAASYLWKVLSTGAMTT